MLSLVGWLDGLTALTVVIFGLIFGLLSFYHSFKLDAKLLGITGLATTSVGFTLLGPAVDFLTILITGKNIEPYWLYGLLSYIWVAPILIFGLYLGAELILPKKKWIILIIYSILSVIFEILLIYYILTDPSEIFDFPPDPRGESLLNSSLVRTSPIFIMMVIFLISGLIFNGFGFLNKSMKSSGELRKKFLYLSLGWILFIVCGALDGVFDPGIAIFFIRIGTILSIVFMYLGVRIT
ncbi:MAG: hypothetical protein EU539_03235 [Promethearchaeota archaeon]|nr:MAG: hypothetical protein EU539_03235 [Candidatus Lokiarchaeota archaeon]